MSTEQTLWCANACTESLEEPKFAADVLVHYDKIGDEVSRSKPHRDDLTCAYCGSDVLDHPPSEGEGEGEGKGEGEGEQDDPSLDRSAYKVTIVFFIRDAEIRREDRELLTTVISESDGECTLFTCEYVPDALSDPHGRPSLGPVFGWDLSALERSHETRERNPGPVQVPATAWTDDHRVEVSFDAARWLTEASVDEIRRLEREEWSRGYAADEVARDSAAWDAELAEMFRYLDTINRGRPLHADATGFEVEVDAQAGRTFLSKTRPEALPGVDLDTDVQVPDATHGDNE